MIAVFLAPQNENNFSENALILFDWTFIWHLVQSEFKNLSLLNYIYFIFNIHLFKLFKRRDDNQQY